MISEDEAFWAGIAVATMMLGGGFSMLFLRTLTGEGAVVLALGLMTMALTMQMRAKPRRYIEAWSQFESHALTPTPPVESPEESSIEPEQTHIDSYVEQESSQPQEEAAQPTEQPKPEEQPIAEHPQPQQAEQVEEPSAQPEAPKQEDAEPKPSEQLEEEPIIVF